MIRRILALRYVCKKYNLRFDWINTHWFISMGSIGWTENETQYTLIRVPLFNKWYWEILYHEIGHLVCKRSLNFTEKHCNFLNEPVTWGIRSAIVLLEEEATASKFAIRVMKGRANKEVLKHWWYSYTSYVAGYMTKELVINYTDVVSKMIKVFK